ncbi:MAG TPA: BBP7 family outer membrane beta-barrel protein, partial [Gemmataceae bacterium]|nr:BBP7 family outer membrane beta-barrel protein [Gemmataceae bacterium]
EFGGFLLETRSKGDTFEGNSVGFPVLAIPFFNSTTGAPGSYIISFPGINTGSATVEAETRAWGAEANAVYNAFGGPGGGGGLQFLCGARYFELEERFSLNTTSTTFGVPPALAGNVFFPGGGGVFAGTDFSGFAPFTVSTSDEVRTFNEFYGAQIGFRGDACYGKWTLGIMGKAAAGINRQRVDLLGSSTLVGAGTTNTQQGGILNTAPDICRVRKDRFAILPEGNINLGYNITNSCRINVGYNFLYINRVARPLAITTPPNLNLTQVPTSPTFGAASPGAPQRDLLNDTDFYLHGFNFGLQLSF